MPSELIFVNFSNPKVEEAGVRKLVRSRATAHSHRDPDRKPKAKGKKRVPARPRSLLVATASSSSSSEDEFALLHVGRQGETGGLDPELVSPELIQSGLLRSRPRLYPVSSPTDPFGAYPVPSQPWFQWVMDFYQHVQLPPGLAVVQQSNDEGRQYITWHLREAMSDPAMFYMQLLNASAPLVVQGRLPRDIIIWLRCMLVSALNEAIHDPVRAVSTPVLLTVASIALHERLYGDVNLAVEVHGRAYFQMLSMRGGIEALGVPRIGIKLLGWSGHVIAASNANESFDSLMNAWAPDELRSRHPGYENNGPEPDGIPVKFKSAEG